MHNAITAALLATPGHEMIQRAEDGVLHANPHLTEERFFCPATCQHWQEEDGKKIQHGRTTLEDGLLWLVGGAG